MSAVQIRDILESLQTFYLKLSERFAREQQRVSGEQLAYIAGQEKQLEAGFEGFEVRNRCRSPRHLATD